MTTRYFVRTMLDPPTLLRRTDTADEMFRNGRWMPTKVIVDYMFGHDDNVDDISEAKARRIEPAAFPERTPPPAG